jgi:alkanesulfonate monooxygenase SsuD/methylene tetrahydromethanopterin reductase-like flavin-dependent oxidoreductase (luciferase family)
MREAALDEREHRDHAPSTGLKQDRRTSTATAKLEAAAVGTLAAGRRLSLRVMDRRARILQRCRTRPTHVILVPRRPRPVQGRSRVVRAQQYGAAMAIEIGMVLQSASHIVEEARLLESWGCDYACAGEHVSFNVPVGNSFISLAVAAGSTTSIGLMSTIVLTPLYPAAILAKLGAALHVASGGRYNFGVGVGGEMPTEFQACGVPVHERGARSNEALEVIRLLWSTNNASFAGRFNSFEQVTIAPRRDLPPPIWVSGRSKAAMRRTARFGDGWLPYMYTPQMFADSMMQIEVERERDSPVRGGLFIWGCVHEDRAVAQKWAIDGLSRTYAQDFSKLVGKYAFAGDPGDVVTRLREFGDAGVQTLIASFACPPDQVDAVRRLFARDVLPALKS